MKEKLKIRFEIILLYLLIFVTVFLIAKRYLPFIKKTIDLHLKTAVRQTFDMELFYKRSIILPGRVSLYNVVLRKIKNNEEVLSSRIPKLDINYKFFALLRGKFKWTKILLNKPILHTKFPFPVTIKPPRMNPEDIVYEKKRIRIINGKGVVIYKDKTYPIQDFGFYLKLEPGYFSGEIEDFDLKVSGFFSIDGLRGTIKRDDKGKMLVENIFGRFNDDEFKEGRINFVSEKKVDFSFLFKAIRIFKEVEALPKRINLQRYNLNISRDDFVIDGKIEGKYDYKDKRITLKGDNLKILEEFMGPYRLSLLFIDDAIFLEDFFYRVGNLFFDWKSVIINKKIQEAKISIAGNKTFKNSRELDIDFLGKFRRDTKGEIRIESRADINKFILPDKKIKVQEAKMLLSVDINTRGEEYLRGEIDKSKIIYKDYPEFDCTFRFEGDNTCIRFPEIKAKTERLSIKSIGFINENLYQFMVFGAGKDRGNWLKGFSDKFILNDFEFSSQIICDYKNIIDEEIIIARGAEICGAVSKNLRIELKNIFSDESKKEFAFTLLNLKKNSRELADFIAGQGNYFKENITLEKGEILSKEYYLKVINESKVIYKDNKAYLKNIAFYYKNNLIGNIDSMNLAFLNENLVIDKFTVKGDYGEFTLKLNFGSDKAAQFYLNTPKLSTRIFELVRPQLTQIKGDVRMELYGDINNIEGSVYLQGGVFMFQNKQMVVDIDGKIQKNKIFLDKFYVKSEEGEMSLTGDYSFEDTGMYKLIGELYKFNPTLINVILGKEYFGDGELSGKISLSRTVDGKDDISGELNIDTTTYIKSSLLIDRDLELKLDRGRFLFHGQTVTIENVGGFLEGLPFEVKGKSILRDVLDIELFIKGREFMLSSWGLFKNMKGFIEGKLEIFGKKDNPTIKGRVDATDVTFTIGSFKDNFANGEFHLYGDKTGHVRLFGKSIFKGGSVEFTGYMPDLENYTLNLSGQGAEFDDFGLQGTLSANITLQSAKMKNEIKGKVILADGIRFYPRKLQRVIPKQDRNIQLNLLFLQEGILYLLTDRWKLELQGGFRLKNTFDNPKLVAEFIVTGGEFALTPELYMEVVEGKIVYPDDETKPTIELICKTNIRKINIYLKLSGLLSSPTYNFYSMPEMSKEDIYSLLFFNRTEKNVIFDILSSEITSGVASSLPGVSTVGENVSRAFGLDYLMIEPYVRKEETGEVEEAVIRIEKDITSRFQTSITKRVEDKTTEYGFGLQLREDLKLEGVKDSGGDYWVRFRLDF
ncbi:MAG: translocation/assembly module TamB domain-containing protein [Candidatus Hydrogenedentota bacterium]